jgi:hypothetical protein
MTEGKSGAPSHRSRRYPPSCSLILPDARESLLPYSLHGFFACQSIGLMLYSLSIALSDICVEVEKNEKIAEGHGMVRRCTDDLSGKSGGRIAALYPE